MIRGVWNLLSVKAVRPDMILVILSLYTYFLTKADMDGVEREHSITSS